MTTRTYVIDTSVLLSDPWAVTRFAEHHVVLPLVVIKNSKANATITNSAGLPAKPAPAR